MKSLWFTVRERGHKRARKMEMPLSLTRVEFDCVTLSKSFWSIIYNMLIVLDAAKIFPMYTFEKCYFKANVIFKSNKLHSFLYLKVFQGLLCVRVYWKALGTRLFTECFPNLLDCLVFEACPWSRFDGTTWGKCWGRGNPIPLLLSFSRGRWKSCPIPL